MIPTPFHFRDRIGKPENYFIHDGYSPRFDNWIFDDTVLTDEFQREVYEYARQVYNAHNLHGVLDVGCGSGYKLAHYFAGACTLGIELPFVVEFLNRQYPDYSWRTADFNRDTVTGYDLVICADVIEHLVEPNDLLDFLKRTGAARIIIITPERDELQHGTWDGPPKNMHHVREWSWQQFHEYMGSHFEVIEHFVIMGAQVVDCRIK